MKLVSSLPLGYDPQSTRSGTEIDRSLRKDYVFMMSMIGHMIFGLIVGFVARFIFPGWTPHGLILTMLLGLAGAWLGGLIGRLLGLYNEGHPAGFFMAVVGALVLLFLYHLVAGGTGRASIPPTPTGIQARSA